MCDTLGRLTQGGAIFAKNSDRSPNEAQLLEFYPRQVGLTGDVRCTYISIPQVSRTYSVLLSRPAWMWGAEMGINEQGLCIGNEAVFTKGPYGKTGLTGMDMVRLALERCATAREALELLIGLLQEHGQGGNCGFDHDFYYDNAFLLLDRKELLVLETAGKEWVWKRYDRANISNRLSIGADGDGYSAGQPLDFRKRYTEPVFTAFSGSGRRSRQLRQCLADALTPLEAMAALRCHDHGVENPFARGSVSSACMHYGGMVGDHTTQSMVVSLGGKGSIVWSTGCSVPCVSLFKPWYFGSEPVLPVTAPGDPAGRAYWMEAEAFRRELLGKRLPGEFHAQRDDLEKRWVLQAQTVGPEAFPEFSRQCLEEEKAFYAFWKARKLETVTEGFGFRSRWEKKNDVLFAD